MDEPIKSATETKNVTYKRRIRNILIHKPMQREFTFVIISLLMVSSLAIGFMIHDTIRAAAFGGGFHFGRINPYEVLSEVSYQLIVRVTCILFITLIVLGAFGIFFLHRVAGPVYRFRQVLIRLNENDIPHPIRLREGDFFTEVANELNRLMEKMRFEQDKFRSLRQKVEQLLVTNPPDHIARAVGELKNILDQAKQ